MINHNKIITVLIPFELVFDIEYGLIKLIRDKYYDKSVFNHLIESDNDIELFYNIKARPTRNPLYNFYNDTKVSIEEINSFYNEFMDTEYRSILDRLITTDLYNATILFKEAEGINATIWCKNPLEVDYLESIKDKYNLAYILEEDIYKLPYDLYNTIYIKDLEESAYLVNKIQGKNLYVADYGFNIQGIKDGMIELSTIPYTILSGTNNISLIELHHIDMRDLDMM